MALVATHKWRQERERAAERAAAARIAQQQQRQCTASMASAAEDGAAGAAGAAAAAMASAGLPIDRAAVLVPAAVNLVRPLHPVTMHAHIPRAQHVPRVHGMHRWGGS